MRLKWKLFPPFIGASALLLGLAGMALIMAFPDNQEFYIPVFHLNSMWFLTVGIVAVRSGVHINEYHKDHNQTNL